LSRKTILNIVGVLKLVLGRKVWLAWELDLGRPKRERQRYFTQEQLRQIIEVAPGDYRVLFALLAATGLRMGEAAGLHLDDLDLDNGVISVRRSVWNGQELEPKTENAVREVDIDPALAALLRDTSDRVDGSACSKRGMVRRCRLATSAIGCCIRSWPDSGSRRQDCTRSGIRESPCYAGTARRPICRSRGSVTPA
jgi:integrase